MNIEYKNPSFTHTWISVPTRGFFMIWFISQLNFHHWILHFDGWIGRAEEEARPTLWCRERVPIWVNNRPFRFLHGKNPTSSLSNSVSFFTNSALISSHAKSPHSHHEKFLYLILWWSSYQMVGLWIYWANRTTYTISTSWACRNAAHLLRLLRFPSTMGRKHTGSLLMRWGFLVPSAAALAVLFRGRFISPITGLLP